MKKSSVSTIGILIVFTILYIATIVYIGIHTKQCSLSQQYTELVSSGTICLTLNELGDFLAGAFAPLAFLWLAGAVFIQSKDLAAQQKELEDTRKVLTEQVKETRASTEFIKQQTDILKKQQSLREQEQADEEFDEFVAGIIGECREIQTISIEMVEDGSGLLYKDDNSQSFCTCLLGDSQTRREGIDFFVEFRRSIRASIDYINSNPLPKGIIWSLSSGTGIDQLRTLISGFGKKSQDLSAAHRVRRTSLKPESLLQLFSALEELISNLNNDARKN